MWHLSNMHICNWHACRTCIAYTCSSNAHVTLQQHAHMQYAYNKHVVCACVNNSHIARNNWYACKLHMCHTCVTCMHACSSHLLYRLHTSSTSAKFAHISNFLFLHSYDITKQIACGLPFFFFCLNFFSKLATRAFDVLDLIFYHAMDFLKLSGVFTGVFI